MLKGIRKRLRDYQIVSQARLFSRWCEARGASELGKLVSLSTAHWREGTAGRAADALVREASAAVAERLAKK